MCFTESVYSLLVHIVEPLFINDNGILQCTLIQCDNIGSACIRQCFNVVPLGSVSRVAKTRGINKKMELLIYPCILVKEIYSKGSRS